MRFGDWTGQWECQATASQHDMQMFMGSKNPVTLFQGITAYVDPACPCQPGHEEWAFIDQAMPGRDAVKRGCLFLQVSQPATFQVLFWYDPDGVPIDDNDEQSRRYWYRVSVPFGHGCSWVSYPTEDGEYLCCFEKRRIRVVKKIATIQEAEERTRSSGVEDATKGDETNAR